MMSPINSDVTAQLPERFYFFNQLHKENGAFDQKSYDSFPINKYLDKKT